jgi:hypothetical protein
MNTVVLAGRLDDGPGGSGGRYNGPGADHGCGKPGAMAAGADERAGKARMPRQVSVSRARGEPSPVALGR